MTPSLSQLQNTWCGLPARPRSGGSSRRPSTWWICSPSSPTLLASSSRVSRCVYISLLKRVSDFPAPSRDVTNQTLPGREILYCNYSRPGRVWSVTSRLGTGKSIIFFYSVGYNDFNNLVPQTPLLTVAKFNSKTHL